MAEALAFHCFSSTYDRSGVSLHLMVFYLLFEESLTQFSVGIWGGKKTALRASVLICTHWQFIDARGDHRHLKFTTKNWRRHVRFCNADESIELGSSVSPGTPGLGSGVCTAFAIKVRFFRSSWLPGCTHEAPTGSRDLAAIS